MSEQGDGGGLADPFGTEVVLELTLEEATTIACAVAHHRDAGFALVLCQAILKKIEEACK